MTATNGSTNMSPVQGRVVPGVEGRNGKFPGPNLMPELHAIQHEHGWLPREELIRLSARARRPLYEIQSIVSFYPHFRTAPPRRVQVSVCHDLSCYLHGAEERIAEVRARYGDDIEVEVTESSCLGRCDIAPAVTVGEQPANIEVLDGLVDAGRGDGVPDAEAKRADQPYANDPYAVGEERYRSVRRFLAGELAPEEIIQSLKDAGLVGMGGAGFPTGLKWELVRKESSTPKYVVCNADESEPGSFKDRQILASQPHLVLEGIVLGMLVVGAEEGWLFIRHEYGPEEHMFRAELAAMREQGLLGDDVLGSGRRLEVDVFVSPGGYILGEETALLECMEGHRGEPRNKPPFPGVYGLHGQPTLINSVETLADVPVIVERGADWWKGQGVRGATGLKFVAVSGHVEKPDVYCIPLGTTGRELLEMAGGMQADGRLLAFQPGGASSNFLGPDKLDTPLDWKPMVEAGSMLGAGAMVFMAEGTNLLGAGTNVLRFFRNESCGKCVPCRVGSHKALEIMEGILESGAGPDAVDGEVADLEETARLTSICGLGQVAMAPLMSVVALQTESARAAEQADRAAETRPDDVGSSSGRS
jgi:NADH:ubiquinone oxidoreductase subunit F (NADH-binding)/NADH:ubiquinone oxidoreductase subunit E